MLYVCENTQCCSAQTVTHLQANLEGHTNKVSYVCANFTVTGSVEAVIDLQVAMSLECDGLNLVLLTVSMPYAAALIESSATSSPPASDDVDTTKSSSPIVGSGPPLTYGFGSIYETVGLTGALILMAGTTIWWLCKNQTKSELCAATKLSKLIKWLRVVLMADISLPYRTAIIVGDEHKIVEFILLYK